MRGRLPSSFRKRLLCYFFTFLKTNWTIRFLFEKVIKVICTKYHYFLKNTVTFSFEASLAFTSRTRFSVVPSFLRLRIPL